VRSVRPVRCFVTPGTCVNNLPKASVRQCPGAELDYRATPLTLYPYIPLYPDHDYITRNLRRVLALKWVCIKCLTLQQYCMYWKVGVATYTQTKCGESYHNASTENFVHIPTQVCPLPKLFQIERKTIKLTLVAVVVLTISSKALYNAEPVAIRK